MSDAEVKKALEKAFDEIMAKTKIVFVPDKTDPFNLDKTMVWFITDDPYADMFIKLRLPDDNIQETGTSI